MKKDYSVYNANYEQILKEIAEGGSPRAMAVNQIKPDSKVLEFGASSGYMTRYLKEEKNCSVYINEYDKTNCELAIPYSEDYVMGDCENYEWIQKFKGQKFDYITFTDVLEHLKNPWAVLKEVKNFLKDDGEIIISLPNITYKTVLIDLIKYDKFQYASGGILDDTHLRFFTEESAKDLIKSADMKIADFKHFKGTVVANEKKLKKEIPFFFRKYIEKNTNCNTSVFFMIAKKEGGEG